MEKTPFGNESIESLFERLKTCREGLSQKEADLRLKKLGLNSLNPTKKGNGALLFLSQFKSPLILLLLAASLLSYFLGSDVDAAIIFTIVFLSGLLGFFQEKGALNALESLLALVAVKANVMRDGIETEISMEHVTPGDLLVLRSGDIIPADGVVMDGNHFFVDESTLTGESAPASKNRGDPIYMGTMVVGGGATAIVASTGKATQYGHITERTRFRTPETAFEIGVRKFGFFLLMVTLVLIGVIFIVNMSLHRPFLDSLLFSLALAVGLTPQLLPAIITINLSHGARRMAKERVVVKRLASIENFGQMNVLCADKTGTITEGKIRLDSAVNAEGRESERTAFYAFLSARFQTTYPNPLDRAILAKENFECADWHLTGEIPYDFQRKRLSVIFGDQIIAKGAVPQILEVCDRFEIDGGETSPIEPHRIRFLDYFEGMSQKGFRTVAVAYGAGSKEEKLILLGFLHFADPLKPNIAQVVQELKNKGVQLKIITGDHHSVALHAAIAIGMSHAHLITGKEMEKATPEELKKIVREKNIFAEIDPNEKEKIVLAIRNAGHVVGYLGDGINDVAALHSADVSIAVDTGADAAKETADIVLLDKDLSVLRAGIEEGRLTFANTLKYVFMATSANFGNMFSMAGASLFLPFLPLLPKQVLLVNLLTDIPEMAIGTDRVDPDRVYKPVKWDLRFIGKFMFVFGLISSIFDYLTFAVLLYFLKAGESLFQTGWFVESVLSATLVVFAIRTRHPLFRSKPGRLLTLSIFGVAIAVLFIPSIPFLGFVPLPAVFYWTLAPIVLFYLATVEIAKRFFFHRRSSS